MDSINLPIRSTPEESKEEEYNMHCYGTKEGRVICVISQISNLGVSILVTLTLPFEASAPLACPALCHSCPKNLRVNAL